MLVPYIFLKQARHQCQALFAAENSCICLNSDVQLVEKHGVVVVRVEVMVVVAVVVHMADLDMAEVVGAVEEGLEDLKWTLLLSYDSRRQ